MGAGAHTGFFCLKCYYQPVVFGRACRTIYINPSRLVGLLQVRERPDADPAQAGEVHQHPHRHRSRLPRLPLLQATSVREWRPNQPKKIKMRKLCA